MTPDQDVKHSFYRLLLLVLLVTVIVSGSTRMTVYAEVNVPDNIRVALFVNLGSGKYQSLTSTATLTSSGGMKLSWRDPAGSLSAGSIPAGQAVRFAVDGYRALVLETTDLNAAMVVLKKLQASTNSAFVTKLSKSGKAVYQVTEGNYSSAGGAASAVSKWSGAGVASGIQSSKSARAIGPWSVEAGPYTSHAEAVGAAELLGSTGLEAYVGIKPVDGGLSYIVRVGQEIDSSSLSGIQQAVSAAGGLNAHTPAASEPYAIIRDDMTYHGSANKPIAMYAIPANSGAVLRADPEDDSGLQVIERSKRTYRGSMEISTLNQTLAVVNDVDFEQYLYSVVGAEVGSSWPIEAQKAQAVAARSYAVASGLGYQIAHVVDTTNSQAYYGIGHENANSTSGVKQTAGQVLTSGGKVISAVFSSNAGGVTADNKLEIWGGDNTFLPAGVTSPDTGPSKGKLEWVKVSIPSGQAGYIRSDLLVDSGQLHSTGAKMLRVTSQGTSVRSRPQIVSTVVPIAKLDNGTLVIQLDKVEEYTEFSWVEAPMSPEQLLASINKRAKTPIAGPLRTLEVTKRGPSGRVIEVKANGVIVNVGASDNLRGALNGLRSTLFSVEETGRYTVLAGDGEKRDVPEHSGGLQVIGADGITRSFTNENVYVLDGNDNLRAGTAAPEFVFSGKGFGHGLGMSQWGARGLAEQGYDYQSILKYYYKNVMIEEDAI